MTRDATGDMNANTPANSAGDSRTYARLRWHARRGLLENDILLERFMDAELTRLSPEELLLLGELLRMEDNDLLDVLMGRAAVGNPQLAPLVERIRSA
jgi:antitoxin CptB